MADKNFDLNKTIQKQSPIHTPINYGDLDEKVQKISKSFEQTIKKWEDYRKSLGVKTEEEKQEEFKKIYEGIQERTKDLGEGDSATDWYMAIQQDPEKQAEWQRNAALTNKIGLSVATLPWTIYGGGKTIKNAYDLLKFGLTNPAGKTAAVKAAIGTLAGEVSTQASDRGKNWLNNSTISDSKFNTKLAQPLLSALPYAIDTDRQIEKRLSTGVVDMAADILAETNIPQKARTHQQLGKKLHDIVKKISKKDGDILLEAFPARPEYLVGLDDGAKQLYERAISTGDGLIGNGIYLGMSGNEIAKREVGKSLGFGNNGIVLLRAAGPKQLASPSKVDSYTFVASPGLADKYAISTKKGKTFSGYFTDSDQRKFYTQLQKIDDRIQHVQNDLEKALESDNRGQIIENLRELDALFRRRPSDVQVYNAGKGTLSKFIPTEDLAAELGETLRRQMSQKPGGPGVIRAGEIGLDTGLEQIVENKTGINIIEPLVYRDNTDLIQIPTIPNVNQLGAMKIENFIEQFSETYPHLRKYMTDQASNLNFKVAYPDVLAKMFRKSKDPERYVDSAITQGFIGRVADSTDGLGPVPTITFVGQSPGLIKGIGSRASGVFTGPGILKLGGHIPTYLKIFG